jgi:iron complex outermembrane receptor protein
MTFQRTLHTLACGGALVAMLAVAAPALAQQRSFDVPAEDARKAIPDFARQAGVQISAPTGRLRDVKTKAVKGTMDARAALRAMIEGTGLSVVSDDGTLIILHYGAAAAATLPTGEADAGSAPATSESAEILVTAQKREQRLQDVPVPVTVIRTQSLVENNIVLMRDYLNTIPGVRLMPGIENSTTVAIRGITTGTGNPSTAIMIDGVGYNTSTNTANGRAVPDLDPGDLVRIEVLRGPQGTLYGADSLGGAINFITRGASTSRFSGQAQVGVNGVENGGSAGYNARLAVNVPLANNLAVRASGFVRNEPGYIDNIRVGDKAVNEANSHGWRVAALWTPIDELKVELTALNQRIKVDGDASVTIGLGDLQQDRIPDTGFFRRDVNFYSAKITGRIGRAELTSLTGFARNKAEGLEDLSTLLGATANARFGVTGGTESDDLTTKKFTQEFRLAIPIGEHLQWLVGAFYTKENANLNFATYANVPATGAVVGRISTSSLVATFREYAAFTDLTVKITDKFDVQVGGRVNKIRQTSDTISNGILNPALSLQVKSDATTYLLTPRYRFSPNLMVYARIASGYRAGGPNSFAGGVVPPLYQPDKTVNYEIGLKGNVADGLLSLDASVYHIDWDNLQFNMLGLNGIGTVTTFTNNGGKAKSEGVELSVQARPARRTNLGAQISVGPAKLTQGFPAGSTALGNKGDRLPYSRKFSAQFTARQEFAIGSSVTAFVGGDVDYVSSGIGPFTATTTRQQYPSYTQVNLNAGFKRAGWLVNAFLTNVTDARQIINGGIGVAPPNYYAVIRPRSYGLSITRDF